MIRCVYVYVYVHACVRMCVYVFTVKFMYIGLLGNCIAIKHPYRQFSYQACNYVVDLKKLKFPEQQRDFGLQIFWAIFSMAI